MNKISRILISARSTPCRCLARIDVGSFPVQSALFFRSFISSAAVTTSEDLHDSVATRDQEQQATTLNLERLSKFIANTGICSRKEAENRIKMGRVILNGALCTKLGTKVSTLESETPSVIVDGIKIEKRSVGSPKSVLLKTKPRLWGFLKIRNELVADVDAKLRPLMKDRIKEAVELGRGEELHVVSKLDFNTEGLCLYSNNAVLARLIDSEPYTRYYRARVHGLITESKLIGIRSGVFVHNRRQPKLTVDVERAIGTNTWLTIATTAKSSRVVTDILKQVKLEVTRLICVGVGPYKSSMISGNVGFIEMKVSPSLENDFYQIKASPSGSTEGVKKMIRDEDYFIESPKKKVAEKSRDHASKKSATGTSDSKFTRSSKPNRSKTSNSSSSGFKQSGSKSSAYKRNSVGGTKKMSFKSSKSRR